MSDRHPTDRDDDERTHSRRSILRATGVAAGSLALGGVTAGSAAGRPPCDGATETRTETGSLSGPDDGEAFTYDARTDDPCELSVALSSEDATDFDLYLTLDGRTPTTDDFDRQSKTSFVSGETITLGDDEVDATTTLGILVDSYTAGGSYTLEFTETAPGGGGNQPPTASFSASKTSVTVGETVEFDATAAADPDGSIAGYDWAFGDGTTASGETATQTYDAAGDYAVELTVTDDDGATASATETITVESGGGGGECGRVETTTRTGTLDGRGDGDASTYAARTADPCSLTLDLSGDPGTDFDLYLTLDGRPPTTSDYDRRGFTYGSDELIEVEGDVIPDDPTFGLLVNAYSGSGDYTLAIEEVGGEGSDEPEPNDPPSAALTADPTTVTVGDAVEFDATGSSDPDGSIASYDWAFGDGTDATGATTTHAYGDPGEYAAELTVTDDDGATDSATRTITVEPDDGGGTCGDATASEQYDGTLFSFFGGNSYTYEADTADPCRVTLTLDGPAGGNFDLYVTTDGRTPSPDDFDERSASPNSQEEVVLADGAASGPTGIYVDPASGFGQYTLVVAELGR